jgi:ABC-type cobalamin transport system ATPase subunit
MKKIHQSTAFYFNGEPYETQHEAKLARLKEFVSQTQPKPLNGQCWDDLTAEYVMSHLRELIELVEDDKQ